MRHFETVIYTHNEAKQTTGHWLSSCWFKTHYTHAEKLEENVQYTKLYQRFIKWDHNEVCKTS